MINPLPQASISGSVSVCKGDSSPLVVFKGRSGKPPYTFIYKINGGSNLSISSKSGDSAVIKVPTGTVGTFNYNLFIVIDGSKTSCSKAENQTATVKINALPAGTISGGGSLCQFDTTQVVKFKGSGGIRPYIFNYTINGGNTNQINSGSTDSAILKVSASNSGSYVYKLIKTEESGQAKCASKDTASVKFNIIETPDGEISGGTNVCQNSTSPKITFTAKGGLKPYTFTYRINTGSTQVITTTTGNTVSLNVPTNTSGIYTYYLENITDSLGCGRKLKDSTIISVNSLPGATIKGDTTVCQYESKPNLTFTGNNGTPPFTFVYQINSGPQKSVKTNGGNSIQITVQTDTSGIFEYKLISVSDSNKLTCSQTSSVSAVVKILESPIGTISPNFEVCQFDTVERIFLTAKGGTKPYTFTYSINGGKGITINSKSSDSISIQPITDNFGILTYQLLNTRDTNSCTSNVSDTCLLVINQAAFGIISGNQTVCVGDTSTFVLLEGLAGSPPFKFNYSINKDSAIDVRSKVGNQVRVKVNTNVSGRYVYYLNAVSDSNGCKGFVSDSVVVNVIPKPKLTINGPRFVCINSSTARILFTGAGSVPPYKIIYQVNHDSAKTIFTGVNDTVSVSLIIKDTGQFIISILSISDTTKQGCANFDNDSFTLKVIPLSSASISGSVSVCKDDPAPRILFSGSGATAPYTFTYTLGGGAPQTITSVGDTVSLAVSTSTAGTFVYKLLRVQDSSSLRCSRLVSDSVTIVINPLPQASISGSVSVCKDDPAPRILFSGSGATAPYTFTYTLGGGAPQTITSVGDTVSLAVSTSTAGTFVYKLLRVQDSSSLRCSRLVSDSVTIVINPLPQASISGSVSVCKDDPAPRILFSGSGATAPYTFTYTLGGGAPQTITSVGDTVSLAVSTSTAGTFVYKLLRVQDSSSLRCSRLVSDSVTIVINPLPQASISGSVSVCKDDPAPRILFSGSGATAPYTFTYTLGGGAPQTITSVGDTVSLAVSTSTAGTFVYKLLRVQDSSSLRCSRLVSDSVTIVINPLPQASISGSVSVCKDDPAPRILFSGSGATAPYTFTYTLGGGAPQTITSVGDTVSLAVSTSTAGTFVYKLLRVQDSSSLRCSRLVSDSVTIVINPLPQASISGSVSVCKDDPAPRILFSGSGATAPYTFTYTLGGGAPQTITSVGDTVSLAVSTSTAGTFVYKLLRVQDSSSLRCSRLVSDSVTIVINPLPQASISGSVSVCKDDPAPRILFSGSGATAPYTFTYTLGGGAPQTITSVGDTVSLAVSTSTAGTFVYKLLRVQDSSSLRCSRLVSDSVTIVINPLPQASISGSVSVCKDDPAPRILFSGSGATAPYTFTYTLGGGAPQTITSVGDTVSLAVSTSTAGTFVYKLLKVQDSSSLRCSRLVSDSVTIVINPLPQASISGSVSVCKDDPAPRILFSGSGATAPYTFTYTLGGGAPQTITSVGDTVSLAVSTSTAGTFVYKLLRVQDSSSLRCSRLVSDSVTIVIRQIPNAIISGDNIVCKDDAQPRVKIEGFSGNPPFIFTYSKDSKNKDTISSGKDTFAYIYVPTDSAGIFKYYLHQVADTGKSTCLRSLFDSVTIVVNDLPIGTIKGDANICINDPEPVIVFYGKGGKPPYVFTYNINGGIPKTLITKTGDSITIKAPTDMTGTFVYNLISILDSNAKSCSQYQTSSITVKINDKPNATFNFTDTICQFTSIPIIATGSSGSPPYKFKYSINAGNSLNASSGNSDTAFIYFPSDSLNALKIKFSEIEDSNKCFRKLLDSFMVVIKPSPSASITAPKIICKGTSARLVFTGHNGNGNYKFHYTLNQKPESTISTQNSDTISIAISTDSAGIIKYKLISVENTDSFACSRTINDSMLIYIKPLLSAKIESNAYYCLNSQNSIIRFIGKNGTAPYTFKYRINHKTTQTVQSSGSDTAFVKLPSDSAGNLLIVLDEIMDSDTFHCSENVSDSINIEIRSIVNGNILAPSGVCQFDTTQNIIFEGTQGIKPFTFIYSLGGNKPDTITTQSGNSVSIKVSTQKPDTLKYTLISVTDSLNNACNINSTSIDSVTLIVYPQPKFDLYGDTSVCLNTPNVKLKMNLLKGTPPYSFRYQLSGKSDTTVTSLSSYYEQNVLTDSSLKLTYKLHSVTDFNKCTNSEVDSAVFIIYSLPRAIIQASALTCKGDSNARVTLTGNSGMAPYLFNYQINSGTLLQILSDSSGIARILVPTDQAGLITFKLVSVTDSNGCDRYLNDSVLIKVNPLPDGKISGNDQLCNSDTNSFVTFKGTGGNAPYEFAYQINNGNPKIVTSSSDSVNIRISNPGIGTQIYKLLSVKDGFNCAAIIKDSLLIKIISSPKALILGDTSVCQNSGSPEIKITGSGGKVPYFFKYSINGGSEIFMSSGQDSSIILSPNTNATGRFVYRLLSVTDTNLCLSKIQDSVILVINSLPNAKITGSSSICQFDTGNYIKLEATAGMGPFLFDYTIKNGSLNSTVSDTSGFVTLKVPGNQPGIFTYHLLGIKDSNNCYRNLKDSLTTIVHEQPQAHILGDTIICEGLDSVPVSLKGLKGKQPYTFLYSVNNGSVKNLSTTNGDSVILHAPISKSGSFVYKVLEISDSFKCSNSVKDSAIIMVNGKPTALISGSGIYCKNDSSEVILSAIGGKAPYYFTYNINKGTPASVYSNGNNSVKLNSLNDQTGTFTYYLNSVVDSNQCKSNLNDSIKITVKALPSALIFGDQTSCSDPDSLSIKLKGTGGTAPFQFRFNVNGGGSSDISSGNKDSVILKHPKATSGMFIYHLLSVTDSGNCVNIINDSAVILIHDSPKGVLNGSTIVCQNDVNPQLKFTGSGGKAPYTFTYKINGGTSGQIKTSTGNSVNLSFSSSNPGKFKCHLVSVSDSNGCSTILNDSAIIEISPSPDASITGSTIVCKDDASPKVTFTGLSGKSPFTFFYSINGGGSQQIKTSSGSSVSVFVPTSTSGSFTYKLQLVLDSGRCTNSFNDSIRVLITPKPDGKITGNNTVCKNSSGPKVTFTGNDGTPPYTFEYMIGAGSVQQIKTTSGSSVDLSAPTSTTGNFVYKLLSVRDSFGCIKTLRDSIVLKILELPDANLIGNQVVCKDQPAKNIVFKGFNGTPGYTFTYRLNGGSVQTVKSGSSDSASLKVVTSVAGTYKFRLVSVSDTNGCSQNVNDSIEVLVRDLPTATITGNDTVCKDAASPLVSLTGNSGISPYTFIYSVNGGSPQSIKSSSGSSANIAVPTNNPGAYKYKLLSVSDSLSCSSVLNDSVILLVNPLPDALVSGNATVCKNDTPPQITFTATTGKKPFVFTYTINNGPIQKIQSSTGNSVSISASTSVSGTFKYKLIDVSDSLNCNRNLNDSAIVIVNTIPNAIVFATGNACENDVSPEIIFVGSEGVRPYRFTYTINGGTPQIVSTTKGDSARIKVPTNTAGNYTYTLIEVADSAITKCSRILSSNVAIIIHPLPEVSFDINKNSKCLKGNNFIFNNTSTISTGFISKNLWDFGDGSKSTQNSTLYNYKSSGTFEVKLISTSNSGCKDSASRLVVVNNNPTAVFNLTDSAQCFRDNLFVFQNNSIGDTLKYLWRFGDGQTASTENPVHSYTTANNFTAELVVITKPGCRDSITRKLIVYPQAQLKPLTDPAGSCYGNTVFFGGSNIVASGSLPIIYDWSPKSNLNQYNIPNPEFKAGINLSVNSVFNYQLKITDKNGCTDSAIQKATIYPKPLIDDLTNGKVCFGDSVQIIPNITNYIGKLQFRWFSSPVTADTLNLVRTSDSIAVFTPLLNPGVNTIFRYNLIVKDAQGCSDTSNREATILVRHQPAKPLIIKPLLSGDSLCQFTQNMNFETLELPDHSYSWDAINSQIRYGKNQSAGILSFDSAGSSKVICTVTIDSTGCSNQSDIDLIVTANSNNLCANVGIKPDLKGLVCLKNNVWSYQWGYDLKSSNYLDSVLNGATNQHYNFDLNDTLNHRYWVLLRDINNNRCFTKNYFGNNCLPIANVRPWVPGGKFIFIPNPFSDKATIEFANELSGKYLIRITDILGKEIQTLEGKLNSEKRIDLDLNSLTYGMYLLNIKVDNRYYSTVKILKQ
ncbi:MAG: T9SS type A sorting domain-containing protein [Flavobacteriales bacterium]|nr:T9SS type A sorting domain-containing protein [Flavobacteriales bacterium]